MDDNKELLPEEEVKNEEAALEGELEQLRDTFQKAYDETALEAENPDAAVAESEADEAEEAAGEPEEEAAPAKAASDNALVGWIKKNKIATAIIVILAIAAAVGIGSAVSSNSKSPDVKMVMLLIDDIGEVDANSGEAIEKAKQAYVNLASDKERKQVSNRRKLTAAEEDYNEIIDFNTRVTDMLSIIKKGYSSDSANFDTIIADCNALLEEYDKMSSGRKASVVSEIEDISSEIELIGLYRESVQECAKAYVEKFRASETCKNNNYKVTDIGCIMTIREGKSYLILALTATNGSKTQNYYAHGRIEKAEQLENASDDILFVLEPISDDYDALAKGNIDFDKAAILGPDYAPATTEVATEPEETTAEN